MRLGGRARGRRGGSVLPAERRPGGVRVSERRLCVVRFVPADPSSGRNAEFGVNARLMGDARRRVSNGPFQPLARCRQALQTGASPSSWNLMRISRARTLLILSAIAVPTYLAGQQTASPSSVSPPDSVTAMVTAMARVGAASVPTLSPTGDSVAF